VAFVAKLPADFRPVFVDKAHTGGSVQEYAEQVLGNGQIPSTYELHLNFIQVLCQNVQGDGHGAAAIGLTVT